MTIIELFQLIVTSVISLIIGALFDLMRKYLTNSLPKKLKGTWRSQYKRPNEKIWTDEIVRIKRHLTKFCIVSEKNEYKAYIANNYGNYVTGNWVSTDPNRILKKPGALLLFTSEEIMYGVVSERDNNEDEVLIPWCFAKIDNSMKIEGKAGKREQEIIAARKKLKQFVSSLSQ